MDKSIRSVIAGLPTLALDGEGLIQSIHVGIEYAWLLECVQILGEVEHLFPVSATGALRDAISGCKLGISTRIRDIALRARETCDQVDLHVWPSFHKATNGHPQVFLSILSIRHQDDAFIRRVVESVLPVQQRDMAPETLAQAHWALVDTTGRSILISANSWSSFITPLAWGRHSVVLDRDFGLATAANQDCEQSIAATMRLLSAGDPPAYGACTLVLNRHPCSEEDWLLQSIPITVDGTVWAYACQLTPENPLHSPPITDYLSALVAQYSVMWRRIARDIREPLDAILGFLNLLLRSTDGRLQPQVIKEAVSIASKQVLGALDDAAQWPKVQEQVRMDMASTSVRRCVHAAKERLGQFIGSKHVHWQGVPEWAHVMANEVALTEVFVDLLQSALECSPATGVVHVEARRAHPANTLDICVRTVTSPDEDSRRWTTSDDQQAIDTTYTDGTRAAGWALRLANAVHLVSRMGGRLESVTSPDGNVVVLLNFLSMQHRSWQ